MLDLRVMVHSKFHKYQRMAISINTVFDCVVLLFFQGAAACSITKQRAFNCTCSATVYRYRSKNFTAVITPLT
ncbi:hypothetical protein B0I18_11417 [Taibaiella chishuiensis]|uniref:Uncharacterized protein n=1 Tax=Taibaiella chishuiensis TaxID=1434707 RepID=A0A2P8CV19_9BACT|nr:hypothetical protein B0I18_11417 [Taibaiella chishuiensis]